MNIINYIINNWDTVLLVIAAIASIVYSIFKGNKSVVMKMLYSLVTEAEKEYGSGTGALKLADVISKIYPKLPPIIKAFVSADRLTKWVEIALATAKETWKKNNAIATYVDKKE